MSRDFDRVWRQKLITKLNDIFGIRNKILPWISDFLQNRSIRLKYKISLSDPFGLRHGLSHGSFLSPILFSLYVSVLEEVTNYGSVDLFADDIIIWSELIAIYKGLQFIDTASDLVFRNVWILTDSHASIHHPSRWTTVVDMTSMNIPDVVVRLSSRRSIYFQWVPSILD
ncbi:autophagy protein 5 [Trichonephila clavipes]|nr:autophagy protein 5 [Trichonephila clavipes]